MTSGQLNNEVASIVLYGTQAIPVRLKILLDRLFCSMNAEDVKQLLQQFGWTHDDYNRGYVLKDFSGRPLSRWAMCTREEEQTAIRLFSRFPEIGPLAAEMMAQEVSTPLKVSLDKLNCSSDSRSGGESVDFVTQRESRSNPGGSCLLSPAEIDPRGCKSADGSLDFGPESIAEPEDLSTKPSPSISNDSASEPKFPNPLQSYFKRNLFPDKNAALKSLVKRKLERYLTLPNSHSGKRRVQCPVCCKTFCDKGALKIHHSAVHLKEMHQCTVKGCKMQFSSRRSRNRHSANPNPKLHTSTPGKTYMSHDFRVVSPTDAAEEYRRLLSVHSAQNHNTSPGLKTKSRRKSVPTKISRPIADEVKMEEMDPEPLAAVEDGLLQIAELEREEPLQPLDLTQGKDSLSAIRHLATLTESLNDHSAPSMAPRNEFSVNSLIAPPSPESTGEGETTPTPSRASSVEEQDEVDADGDHNITMTACKTASGPIEIPINESNPRQCTKCFKTFQNHFSVKTHYQNVHLKLMHKCIVPGCNAAFPSKRSRDRHSSNLNLHRKLLSGARDGAAALHRNIIGVNTPTKNDGQVNGSADESLSGSPASANGARAPEMLQQQFYPYHPSLLPFTAPSLLNQFARMAQNGPQNLNPFMNPWAAMALAAGNFDQNKLDQKNCKQEVDAAKEVPATAD